MAKTNEFLVVGFKRVDYTKKTGGEVHGCEVYVQAVEPDDHVEGMQAEALWISDKYATYAPRVGDICRKTYNRFGNVEDLILI